MIHGSAATWHKVNKDDNDDDQMSVQYEDLPQSPDAEEDSENKEEGDLISDSEYQLPNDAPSKF